MAAQSTGMFPRKGAYVDEARILPADGSDLDLNISLDNGGVVSVLAYVTTAGVQGDQAAAPHLEVQSAAGDVLFKIPGDYTGKLVMSRDCYEINKLYGEIRTVKLVAVGVAGTAAAPVAQVSLF